MARNGPARVSCRFKCPEDESSKSSRNLVVCIDGTSNQFGIKNTNIVELYSHITKSDKQLTYYSSGLGTIAKATGASPRRQVSNVWDIVFGSHLHKVIMASYRWLSDNYQNGDRIFLFGFSRGAYQVRALAAMISRVGLLLPGNDEQIPFAFDLYSKTSDDASSLTRPASVISQPITTKESERKAKYDVLSKSFQKTFCRSDVHVHFVGVWDTVSSVGIGRNRTLPGTTTSNEHVCFFRHALALDERRVKFLPEYVFGGRSSRSDDGRIKEVWFAGCHSDVGGGNRRNDELQSGDIPLLWMRSQAIAAELVMEPADVMWKIDDLNKRIKPSLNTGWWLLELMPLKHLLYYNSDRHTSRPHFGDPRRILPGQKVHVSVLFKNNYKPCARFYDNPIGWPEPMFWNDATSHQRLQHLSPDLWEKDIFDEGFVPTLFDDLKRGETILDALDRLAFLASFDDYKHAISVYPNAEQFLNNFLKSKDRVVRLGAAAISCELEKWKWPPEEMTENDLQQIVNGVSELLKSDKDCRRACTYMPSLCKREELKAGLINDANLRTLVQLCDNTRIAKHEEGTSTIAFHSTQALSMLMKLDDEFAKKLIDIDLVTDVTEVLRSDCKPVLVAGLSVVDGLAKDERGRATMKTGPILATLLKLVQQFDDFVAPAAVRVLCSLLPEDDLRRKMLQFGVLSALLDALDASSHETKQAACRALTEFVQYDDIQRTLCQDGYLPKLAKRAQDERPSKRDGATLALVTLGNARAHEENAIEGMRAAVTKAIHAAKTIPALVVQLNKKSTALSAASALTWLMRIDDVAAMVSDDASGACTAIVSMLRNRWFDGLRGEDGLQVLSKLLGCDRLRSAVLKAGAINDLRSMIGSGRYESTYAGLHYLWVVARLDEDEMERESSPSHMEMRSLVVPVVSVLRAPQRRVQRIAMAILRCLSEQEDLRAMIVDGVLDLLKDRHAGVVFAASTVLGHLAMSESVRDRVVREERFWNLCEEYYGGLNLEYDDRGRGPHAGEVYESVKHLIKRVQAHGSDNIGSATGTGEKENERAEENGWGARVPYELGRGRGPRAYWIATTLERFELHLSRLLKRKSQGLAELGGRVL